jgi:O-methyltransferase
MFLISEAIKNKKDIFNHAAQRAETDGFFSNSLTKHNIARYSILPPVNLYVLYSLAQEVSTIAGDMAEIGVYAGGSTLLLAVTNGSKNIHAFDTFSGIPNSSISAIDEHRGGDFSDVDANKVKAMLGRYKNITIHDGDIAETKNDVRNNTFSFVHVDCDVYKPIKECCEFFVPRLSPYGIIIFDDYNLHTCPGARTAVDEYFGDSIFLVHPTGQGVFFNEKKT